MALLIYNADDFTDGSLVNFVDLYTGTGGDEYPFTNLTPATVGPTIQFDEEQYVYFNGGFVKTLDGFILSSSPPALSQGVAPGLITILFDDLYDQNEVDGVALTRSQEVPAWLIDTSEINDYYYTLVPAASTPGIELTLVNNISSVVADLTWVQLASADPLTGSALTYGATGESLFLPNIEGLSTLTATATSGTTTVFVDVGSAFMGGQYALINAGFLNQEIFYISQVAGDELTTSSLNFNHDPGEPVYVCGYKFWVKCTVPLDATNGQAANFYNLNLRNRFIRKSRA